jgi:methyltransferase-like protein/protein-L-isoaspartate O-methyltransferase
MSEPVSLIKSAYDELPYTSHPFPQTAPENLAAVAHLFGLGAPDVAKARVLELGCSSGGNLIPFAARNPAAELVGIDLSSVQIGLGKKRVDALGLSNIKLIEADLAALDSKSLGSFDFVICHGVYSWVPAHVREAILSICKENLAPDGIAYVSYNVYPGWKAKEIVRDAMMLRGAARATPTERLGYAKGMLDFLERLAPKNSILAKTLELTLPELRTQQDYYLAHEYLEPFNAPCYFQDFIRDAGAHGLAYLAEAQPSTMFVGNYGQDVAEPLLKECGHSQVLLEQYLDFVVNRTFRQTLLVHDRRAGGIRYRLDGERMRKLHFAARLFCQDGPIRLDSSRQTFGTNTSSLASETPAVKAALKVLSEGWPETVSYNNLLERTGTLLGSVSEQDLTSRIDELLDHLVVKGLAQFRVTPVQIGKQAEGRIAIEPAIRRAAEISRNGVGSMIFNAWHEPVPLSPVGALLLPQLDGSRDRADLEKTLHDHVGLGHVRFERGGEPVREAAEVSKCVAEHVEATMRQLFEAKLAVSANRINSAAAV